MAENKATKQHTFRRLEDLNLIDNFLFLVNKNRMVYTIRNHCEEDTSIPYDDGATAEGHTEGRAKGLAEGHSEMQTKMNQLILILSKSDRIDDIIKSATNPEYQQSLFEEFDL